MPLGRLTTPRWCTTSNDGEIGEAVIVFTDQESLHFKMSASADWNSLTGVQEVRKFTSRPVAVRRIWKAIQTLDPGVAPQGAKIL
jgi:hypothetical protein